MSFEKLNLIKPIHKALTGEGYTIPTPIQLRAIPIILQGKDILGCAQTGTGKTAAYAVPILQMLYEEKSAGRLNKAISSLILTPTRELAVQIGESFSTYGKHTGLRNVVVYGGVPQWKQTEKLKKGAEILIATPGRLLDLMNQNFINLRHVKLLVLDEADRMLDMGFINDVKKIISNISSKRQTMLFSATLPTAITKLARTILIDPVRVDISPESPTVEMIKQAVYFVSKQNKKALLIHILKDQSIDSALIFTRTKRGADQVERFLNGSKIEAEAIHGNKSQNARQRALNNFKSKRTRVLVATDLASRGIDVDRLSHVINYEIPDQSENYIHRIGRTGRAGLAGVALSFCDMEEREYLRDINKLISIPIPVIKDHPFVSTEVENENYPRKINNSRPSNPGTYKKKSARVEVNSMGNEIIHKKKQFGRDRNKSRSYGWSKTRGH